MITNSKPPEFTEAVSRYRVTEAEAARFVRQFKRGVILQIGTNIGKLEGDPNGVIPSYDDENRRENPGSAAQGST